jgi:hypothetical protein
VAVGPRKRVRGKPAYALCSRMVMLEHPVALYRGRQWRSNLVLCHVAHALHLSTQMFRPFEAIITCILQSFAALSSSYFFTMLKSIIYSCIKISAN